MCVMLALTAAAQAVDLVTLAQAEQLNWWSILKEAPSLGFLLWFMFVVFPEIRAMYSVVDRLNRASLMVMIAVPELMKSTKAQMEGLVKEIDDANPPRK